VTVFMGVFSFLDDFNAICLASVLVPTVSSLEVFFFTEDLNFSILRST